MRVQPRRVMAKALSCFCCCSERMMLQREEAKGEQVMRKAAKTMLGCRCYCTRRMLHKKMTKMDCSYSQQSEAVYCYSSDARLQREL